MVLRSWGQAREIFLLEDWKLRCALSRYIRSIFYVAGDENTFIYSCCTKKLVLQSLVFCRYPWRSGQVLGLLVAWLVGGARGSWECNVFLQRKFPEGKYLSMFWKACWFVWHRGKVFGDTSAIGKMQWVKNSLSRDEWEAAAAALFMLWEENNIIMQMCCKAYEIWVEEMGVPGS
jgi:hypothetical protein